MPEHLNLDRLRRLQATLERRAQQLDPGNIRAVGFAPQRTGVQARSRAQPSDALNGEKAGSLPITAQFEVRRKQRRVPAERRIAARESVKLLDRSSRHFDRYTLDTDVVEIDRLQPTGVAVRFGRGRATTSLIARWTTIKPPPRVPTDAMPDTGWRWGVLTVSHLFTQDSAARVRVGRKAACGDGPRTLEGRLIARGRIPGGPDVALIETGLDRLWLSGFLDAIEQPEIPPASPEDLLRWISRGTDGMLIASTSDSAWEWQAYFPQFHMPELGRLAHVIRFEVTDASEQWSQASAATRSRTLPLGPGSSGSLLVAGGAPIGLQIAAVAPDFRIGYAQAFEGSLPWLRSKVKATAFDLVRVVSGPVLR